MYLAGYAAECALKEYIISREPGAESLSGVVRRRRARNESTPDLISAAGHNLAILLTFSGLESELDLDEARKKGLGIVFALEINMAIRSALERHRIRA